MQNPIESIVMTDKHVILKLTRNYRDIKTFICTALNSVFRETVFMSFKLFSHRNHFKHSTKFVFLNCMKELTQHERFITRELRNDPLLRRMSKLLSNLQRICKQ